ncbi:VASH1 protein, partial [Polypterus senegalus]|nr:VASH1 protein [Polypterus senegalus]
MPGGRMSSVVGTIPRTEVNEGSATGCEGVAQRGEEEQDDEGEEDLREGSAVLFVNRGGLPVDEATWERMWRHVARIHPEGEDLVRRIRGANDLPKIPIPSVPTFQPSASTSDRLEAIQRFIRDLHFKTQFSGNYFRHIVLGVHSGGRFGALGISRREDLMYKPLTFRTLSELVQEFDVAYHRYWHTLKKVKIGQYVSHDPHSVEQIEWKHSILDVDKLTQEELRKELERHMRDMRLKVRRVVKNEGYQLCAPSFLFSDHSYKQIAVFL